MDALVALFAKIFDFLYTAGIYLVTPFSDMDLHVYTNPFNGATVDITFPGIGAFLDFVSSYVPMLSDTTILDVFAFIFTAGLLTVLLVRIVDIIVP